MRPGSGPQLGLGEDFLRLLRKLLKKAALYEARARQSLQELYGHEADHTRNNTESVWTGQCCSPELINALHAQLNQMQKRVLRAQREKEKAVAKCNHEWKKTFRSAACRMSQSVSRDHAMLESLQKMQNLLVQKQGDKTPRSRSRSGGSHMSSCGY